MPKRIVTNPNRAETARVKLTEVTEQSAASDERASRDRQRKFAGVLRAYNAGLTYEEIADITGLSKIRVSQVLAEQREKVAQMEGAKKPAATKKAATKTAATRKSATTKKASATRKSAARRS